MDRKCESKGQKMEIDRRWRIVTVNGKWWKERDKNRRIDYVEDVTGEGREEGETI